MRLESLSLQDFRNYASISLNFNPGLNIFVGDNAQGKTNLLEAIYVLALSKSYRAQRDPELIRQGADQALVSGQIRRLASMELGFLLSHTERKRLLVNQKAATASRFVGNLNIVLFSPDSLQLVKGTPSDRRRFLDIQICQIDPVYRKTLLEYPRVVRQRNSLLKSAQESRAHLSQLVVWDRQLISLGTEVMLRRQAVVDKLQRYTRDIHRQISQELENLHLIYQPFFADPEKGDLELWDSPEELKSMFMLQLQQLRREELRRGYTLAGPQRDDLLFLINGMDLRKYGSQGQQRSAVLACILAELELMQGETGEYPVVLLDDVMSELDQKRRIQLLSLLNDKAQTIVTTTNLGSFTAEIVQRAAVFNIRQGRIL
jgi:DNA replication and repair protein RecF